MQRAWEFILDLIFPRTCLVCKKEGAWLCSEHKSKALPVNEGFYCFKTGVRCAFGNISLECQKESAFDGLIIITDYDHEIVQKLVHALKYRYIEEMSKLIAESMATFLKANNIFEVYNITHNNSTLIPIPIHTKRLRARGFNQSELIGKELSKMLSVSFNTSFLQRSRHTISQVKLDKLDRQKNIKNAFETMGKTTFNTVLLLDDVITTGGTLEAAAEALKGSGVGRVIGIVYAHRRTKKTLKRNS